MSSPKLGLETRNKLWSSVEIEQPISREESFSTDAAPGPNASSEKGQARAPSAPDGGLRAWLVVLGSAIILGVTFGSVSAFGVYETYYQTNQLSHLSSSTISWIGSLQVCMMFGGGLVAGPLFDRYGARVVLIPASITYVLGIMMTSICKRYYQFILAQGILTGLSAGFLNNPAFSVINHYFNKKRGIANGLAAVGSSMGGVAFPFALQNSFYSETLGFAWGVRIIGFAVLFFLAIACALIKERLPPRIDALFAPNAFLQPSYTFLVIGIFFLLWAMFVPSFYLSEYAIFQIHMSESLGFYLLAILNSTSLFGRLSAGKLADKVGWLNMLSMIGVCNVVLFFCWSRTTTNAGIIVWTAFFGFFSGAVFSLFPASIARVVPKPQLIGVYMGQATGKFAFAGLTSGPIAGALIARYGYASACYFAGASMAVGTGFIAVARLSCDRDITLAI